MINQNFILKQIVASRIPSPYVPRSHRTKNCRKVRCIETGEIFPSGYQASLEMGYSKNAVPRAICAGSRCGGYRWEYVKKG